MLAVRAVGRIWASMAVSVASPRLSFGAQVALGMAAGLALGLMARTLGPEGAVLGEALRTVGQVFVQLLKALVPPLVFTAIVASIAALRDLDNAARLVGRTLAWFAGTALIAVLIGIALGVLIEPGVRAGVDPAAAAAPATAGSWLDFLKGLVPANMLGLTAATTIKGDVATTAVSFNVLQIIVAAIAIGAAAVSVGEAGEAFLRFNASALQVFRRVLRWVIALTPIGSAALIGDAVARYGWETLGSLGAFAGAIYLGLSLVLLLVYPALLVLHGLSPAWFFRAAWPAIQLGFVSARCP
jgi:Na+/H+-dicarboxylate symporter